jgi:hypothetical protein
MTSGAGGGADSRAGLPFGVEEFAAEVFGEGVLFEAELFEEELSVEGGLGAAA